MCEEAVLTGGAVADGPRACSRRTTRALRRGRSDETSALIKSVPADGLADEGGGPHSSLDLRPLLRAYSES
jgi:hypothetical protein